ncbi:hypothetical protein P6709_20125, partial [Jeotgalibacillus sp. ET6]|nr:hypothetical protein [Jeotgalibacillus sp. ET6]
VSASKLDRCVCNASSSVDTSVLADTFVKASYVDIYTRIILPLLKPAIVTVIHDPDHLFA